MTLKQLEAEIKRATKDKEHYIKAKERAVKECLPPHVIADYDKWIAYYDKYIAKYESERPAAIAKAAEKEAKKAAKQQPIKWANGVVIEISYNTYIRGKTPNGKPFSADANNGITGRAGHCWCLRINGETAFTSGTLETVMDTVATN